MGHSFRQSMAWLHTWSGLVTGWVLFFIFVTGTLGYFYVEIDRWMRPELPLATAPIAQADATALADAYLRRAAPDADVWMIRLPTGRQGDMLEVSWGNSLYGRDKQQRVFDAGTTQFVPPPSVRETGGGYALYRMHWKLHYLPQQTGVLLVGLCTMIMLVALLAGIATHKKIFSDFFTFRPRKGHRSWLDMHNLLSVMALPFFLMITFSGLVFYMEFYVPAGVEANFRDKQAYWEQLEPERETSRSGQPGHLLPLAHFQRAAAANWGAGKADIIVVNRPNDAQSEVTLVHSGNGTLLRNVIEKLHFGGERGELRQQETAGMSGPREVRSALLGLHEGIFAGWPLRWLYFISGLSGCAMIATGLILWTVKRREKQGVAGSFGYRLVECLNIGTLVGLPIGIAAYFWANRLLPADMAGRAAWEMHCLFIGWGGMLLWASVRPRAKAWIETLSIAAGAFGLLPLLNMLTSARHLGVSLRAGDWGLASFDLMAFLTGACFAGAAIWLTRKKKHSGMSQRRHQAAMV